MNVCHLPCNTVASFMRQIENLEMWFFFYFGGFIAYMILHFLRQRFRYDYISINIRIYDILMNYDLIINAKTKMIIEHLTCYMSINHLQWNK